MAGHGRAWGASGYTACKDLVFASWVGQSQPREEEKTLLIEW